MRIQDQINKAYENKVIKVHNNLVRETAIRAFSEIIKATPVDTGRARSNWNIAVNAIDATTTENTAAPDTNPALNIDPNDTVYISNNLPYIQRLNDGYSQQAPANFVEKGLMLAKRQAQAAAKRGAR